VLTFGLCVVLDVPLNFANITAPPLLLGGVGVAFKIYYIMAWRSGKNRAGAVGPDASRDFQRFGDRNRVREPVALQRSGHVQHGPIDGFGAGLHDGGSSAVPTRPDGPTAGEGGPGSRRGQRAAERHRRNKIAEGYRPAACFPDRRRSWRTWTTKRTVPEMTSTDMTRQARPVVPRSAWRSTICAPLSSSSSCRSIRSWPICDFAG
jgi:hypothetical protein